jgi:hypothetical protein
LRVAAPETRIKYLAILGKIWKKSADICRLPLKTGKYLPV